MDGREPIDQGDAIEREGHEPTLEDKFAAELFRISKELTGLYQHTLFRMANRWQRRLRHELDGQEGTSRKIGHDFDETFSGEGDDGIDARIETLSLGENEKVLMVTDIHGDEESMKLAVAQVFQTLLESDGKVHFVSLGDFATYDRNESVEPLKVFLLLEALKNVDLSDLNTSPEGEKPPLVDKLGSLLAESGLPEDQVSVLMQKIQNNLELHYLAGNGERYIGPSNQIASGLGREAGKIGYDQAPKLFQGLPLSLMIRTAERDIFASHFLPAISRENAWREEGLASLNDPNLSEKRIQAGVWGGYDQGITDESIASSAGATDDDPNQVWLIGRHNYTKIAGEWTVRGKGVVSVGFPTFQRILSTKGVDRDGLYLFGHVSDLVESTDDGIFVAEKDHDRAVCFHSGKVPKKYMIEIDGSGKLVPIPLTEGNGER